MSNKHRLTKNILMSLLLYLFSAFASLIFLFVSSPSTATASSFTITLNEGWNLLSIPLWADEIILEENDIEAWLAYRDGSWLQSDNDKGFYEEINNPARAVFIKVIRPTQIKFKWAPTRPDGQFAGQKLTPGWSLISSGWQIDYWTILASVYYDGTSGLTKIYAPNEYNGRKEKGFHLPWKTTLNDLTNPNQAEDYDMYPFDGYWVYLQGPAVYFSTPVGNDLPEKIN